MKSKLGKGIFAIFGFIASSIVTGISMGYLLFKTAPFCGMSAEGYTVMSICMVFCGLNTFVVSLSNLKSLIYAEVHHR